MGNICFLPSGSQKPCILAFCLQGFVSVPPGDQFCSLFPREVGNINILRSLIIRIYFQEYVCCVIYLVTFQVDFTILVQMFSVQFNSVPIKYLLLLSFVAGRPPINILMCVYLYAVHSPVNTITVVEEADKGHCFVPAVCFTGERRLWETAVTSQVWHVGFQKQSVPSLITCTDCSECKRCRTLVDRQRILDQTV